MAKTKEFCSKCRHCLVAVALELKEKGLTLGEIAKIIGKNNPSSAANFIKRNTK